MGYFSLIVIFMVYESINQAKFRDGSESYVSFKTLQRRGWEKAAKAIDARIAQRSGQYTR